MNPIVKAKRVDQAREEHMSVSFILNSIKPRVCLSEHVNAQGHAFGFPTPIDTCSYNSLFLPLWDWVTETGAKKKKKKRGSLMTRTHTYTNAIIFEQHFNKLFKLLRKISLSRG